MSAPPFVKRVESAPPRFFDREAAGLRWLAEVPDGVPVVRVIEVDPLQIVLERLYAEPPSPAQADDFGRRLARTHLAPAPVWGRDDGDGFIGPLPLPNGPFSSWTEMWWQGRVEPYVRMAVDGGLLVGSDAARIERVVSERCQAVKATAPGRIHGDLWSGNVVWTAHGAVLIDAASAHGGHPEADLAMLALFGLPYLSRVLSAYAEVNPLAEEWRERVPLMQMHPLLVHVVLFGGSYVDRLSQAVRSLG